MVEEEITLWILRELGSYIHKRYVGDLELEARIDMGFFLG